MKERESFKLVRLIHLAAVFSGKSKGLALLNTWKFLPAAAAAAEDDEEEDMAVINKMSSPSF